MKQMLLESFSLSAQAVVQQTDLLQPTFGCTVLEGVLAYATRTRRHMPIHLCPVALSMGIHVDVCWWCTPKTGQHVPKPMDNVHRPYIKVFRNLGTHIPGIFFPPTSAQKEFWRRGRRVIIVIITKPTVKLDLKRSGCAAP